MGLKHDLLVDWLQAGQQQNHSTPPGAPLLSPIHVTFPIQLIFLDLITRIIFDEYRS